MSFRPRHLIFSGLLIVAALSGCVGRYQSSFSVVVENRAVNAIQVLANGNDMGQVAAGQTASFSLQLPESNANVLTNGVAPTPQAQVTVTAKDLKTGALSTDKSLTLSQSSPTYVTFGAADFPTTVPTIARVDFSPTNPAINQDINFNASRSTGSNLTFAWDFGDGQTGTGVVTTHQYSRPGTQRVVLTVTSDSGQSNSTSSTITVSAAAPQINANFTFSPTTPAINQDVLFAVSGTAGFTGATFAWDFGDGATTTGSSTTATHRYTRAGTFTVTLRASGSVGQPATASRTVTVTATPAGTVNFTLSPTTPGVNDTVFFNASLTTVANATFRWDFGDGSNGSGQTTTHQYSRAATFSVTLTATNDLGQSSSTSKTVTVSATPTQLVADFSFSPTDPSKTNGTNTVIFDATPSSVGVTTWAWDFGDGSDPGSGPRTSHTFSRAGTWVVRLTVTDSTGRTATTTKNVTVAP